MVKKEFYFRVFFRVQQQEKKNNRSVAQNDIALTERGKSV